MKLRPNNTTFLSFSLILITFFSCNSNKKIKINKSQNTFTQSKSSYEMANEYISKLKVEKADTIIFYTRTCIDCCDFFNIFWKSNGKIYLKKINSDIEDADLAVISVNDNKIFRVLHSSYSELKKSEVKENEHRLKNGKSYAQSVDHFCYTQISIFTPTDSVVRNQIKDHDFDKYLKIDQKEKGLLNDNYFENKNSVWNSFLKTIEQEIASTKETSSRELETLRIYKSPQ